MTSFETAATVLGALLVGGALLSGLARRSFLSLTAVFVRRRVPARPRRARRPEDRPALEPSCTTSRSPRSCSSSSATASRSTPRCSSAPGTCRCASSCSPCRSPRSIIALATKALIDLTWTEAFLVGALLSPTDPVLSSSVVNNPRVPRVIRHSLNLESGLNDGLALPAVLALHRGAGGRQRLRVVEVPAAGRDASASPTAWSSATSPRTSCRAAATSSARCRPTSARSTCSAWPS